MPQVSPELKKSIQSMARQYPEFVELIKAWRMTELEMLPFSQSTSLDVLRGRVQVLTEMQKYFGLD